MITFFKILGGYCCINVSGAGKERFLNLCKNKKILIWNLSRTQDSYRFYVSFKAYKMLEEIREKSNTHIKIEGKYGLPFFLYRHKKRKIFFAGIFLCGSMIFFLSLFIWEIRIIGTESYTEDEIRSYLTEQNIHTGLLKRKIDCAVLEENIREDFDRTAWVSCDLEGTLLTVHVKESLNIEDTNKNREEIANDIVALKDGVITSIITRNGTPLVKQGMEVKKGDTLISGIIYYYNDYDELLETSKISADGDVKAETIYHYEETFPLFYYEKQHTNQISKEYTIFISGHPLPVIGKDVAFQKYDTVINIYPLKIGTSFYLPLSLQIKRHMAYVPKPVTLTDKEAKEKAAEKTEYFLHQLKEEGKEIKEKKFQIDIRDGECMIKGKVKVIESIGKIRNIP